MEEPEVDFKFLWFEGMPQRNSMYLFRYVDGEMYEVDFLGNINGKFAIFDDINALYPSQQRLCLTESNLDEIRKFSIEWKEVL